MKTKAHNASWRTCAALTLVLAAVCGIVWAAAGDQLPADSRQAAWSDYDIITQRNIFSRNRGRRAERTGRSDAQETPQPVMPAPESYMVLKGIVAAGPTFAAFIEDTRTSEVYRVSSGDTIAAGTVWILTLDTISYKQEEKESSILVGQTLSGASAQTVLTFDNLMQWSATAASSERAATTEPASEAEAEILRKLLERRKQQLGE